MVAQKFVVAIRVYPWDSRLFYGEISCHLTSRFALYIFSFLFPPLLSQRTSFHDQDNSQAHNNPRNMAAQVLVAAPPPIPESAAPVINVPPSFQISSQDGRLGDLPVPSTKHAPPPLGVLENFTGNFAGTGFNLIFRPNSGQTKFKNPLDPSLPAPPNPPNENVLELNLTTESLSFSGPLGEVPNRGLEKQTDIKLNGVPYVQAINDVTNLATGKGNAPASPIHFEPGLWMHVPATTIGKLFSFRTRDISCICSDSLLRLDRSPHD